MAVVQGGADDRLTPLERFAHFMKRQAAQAGLGARELEHLFRQAARQEEEQAAQTNTQPAHPISEMNFSKSHIDRIFKALACPHPPRPFTRQFLVFTSRKAGLSQAEHKKAWEEAVSLLDALGELPSRRPTSRRAGPDGIPQEATVAELQLRLDLERAQHLETRLRYALRDTRCFVNTLWDIISVLRDVIAHHYALRASLLHGGGNSPRLTQIQSETEQALDYKRSAQAEADRAVARIRVLEERWEQACAEAHRLSLHSEITDFPADNSVLAGPGPAAPLLSQELLAQPTLDDIKAALEKARVINAQEEDSARTLQEALSSSGPFAPDDERLVLVAATRLSDADSRRTALSSLAKAWPDHPDTRDLLLHLAHDPEARVRLAVTESLAACWWDDDTAREALVALAGDADAYVRAAAVRSVVATSWRDQRALDVLLSLARDLDREVRACAADGLAEEWTEAPAARDALIQLLLGPEKSFGIRERAVEGLLANWPHDEETHNGLLRFADSDQDYDFTVVTVARAALLACWAHHPRARSAVLRLDAGGQFFRYVEREMVTRWRGRLTARDSVILMSKTDEAAVAEALDTWPLALDPVPRASAAQRAADFRSKAVDMLSDGWAGDTVARDAVLQRAQDPSPRVRRAVAGALRIGWPDDDAARQALERLARDDDGPASSATPQDNPVLTGIRKARDMGLDPYEAAMQYDAAVRILARRMGHGHPDTLIARREYAVLLGESGDPHAAARELPGVVDDCVRHLGPLDVVTIETKHQSGRWMGKAGNAALAATSLAALADTCISALGATHPATVKVRAQAARWLGESGLHQAATVAFASLAGDCERNLGADSPSTLQARYQGARWEVEGRRSEATVHAAAASFTRLAADCIRALGPVHPLTFDARCQYGRWTGHDGGPEEAVDILERLVEDCQTLLGTRHPFAFEARQLYIRWLGRATTVKAAMTAFAALIDDCQRGLGPAHMITLRTRYLHARCTGKAGDPLAAATALTNLYLDHEELRGRDHPDSLRLRQEQAQWTGEAGDVAAAVRKLKDLADERGTRSGDQAPETVAVRAALAHWTDKLAVGAPA